MKNAKINLVAVFASFVIISACFDVEADYNRMVYQQFHTEMIQQVQYQQVLSTSQQIQACNNIKDPKVRKLCLSRVK